MLMVATLSTLVVDPPRKAKRSTRRAAAAMAKPTGIAPAYRSCAEVRAAGAAPVRRGDAGYSRRLDRDGDGVACE